MIQILCRKHCSQELLTFQLAKSFAARVKMIDKSWLDYLMTQNSNKNKIPFMDISLNKEIVKLSNLEQRLKNISLLDPFRSAKHIDFDVQIIKEGRASIVMPDKEDQYDPDAKFNLFTLYNIVMVNFLKLAKELY